MPLNHVVRVAAVVVGLALVSSCAGLSAARGKSGGPITLDVVFDQNPQARNPEQIAQLVEWMAPDMQRLLERIGYSVNMQANATAFQPGPDHYLLLVHIVNYNAGSKAARMFVGYGAGTLTLDTTQELFAAPGQMLYQGRGDVGSSRDWTNAARKINEQIAREVTKTLNK